MAEPRLYVVEGASRFTQDLSQGVIVVECADTSAFNMAIEELSTAAARTIALGYAASRGVADPRVNGTPSTPYPVNRQGEPLENVRDENGQTLPASHARMQPARYRVDIPVTRRLV